MTLKLTHNECSVAGALRRYQHPRRGVIEILTAGNVIYLRTPRAVPQWRELVDRVLASRPAQAPSRQAALGDVMSAAHHHYPKPGKPH